jgi:hypothetical protein
MEKGRGDDDLWGWGVEQTENGRNFPFYLDFFT